MFLQVINESQLEVFNGIWKESFSENNYEMEEYQWNSKRYLINNRLGEIKGTVELIPYTMDKQKSTIEDLFSFSSLEMTKKTPLHQIFEIDKLSVSKEGRKEGTLENILLFLIDFAKQNRVLFYYALINPLLFRTIKIVYGFPVEKAGRIIKTEDYPIQPMFIDMKKTIDIHKHPSRTSLKTT